MASTAAHSSPIAPTEGVLEALCTRRRRRPTSTIERQYLETAYAENRRPDAATRVKISEHLGWTEKAVMVWFQNRRQKDKSCDSASSSTSSAPSSRLSSPACTPAPTSRPRALPMNYRPSPTSSPVVEASAPLPQLPPTPTTPSFGSQLKTPCSPMQLPASHYPPTPAMSTPELKFDDSDLEDDFNNRAVPGAVVLTPLISPHPRPMLSMHEPSHMSIDTSRPSSPLLSASTPDTLPRVMLPQPHAHGNDNLPGCMRLPSVRTWLDRVVKCTESELHARVPEDPTRFKWVTGGQEMGGASAGHPVPRPAAHGSAFKWPSLPRLVSMDEQQAVPPRTPTLPPIVSASALSSPLDALRAVCAREHAVIASGRPHAARARAAAAPY